METNRALRQMLTCKQQEELLIGQNERLMFVTWESKKTVEKHVQVKLGAQRADCLQEAAQALGIPTTKVTENFLCSRVTNDTACGGEYGGAVFRNYKKHTIQVGIIISTLNLRRQCQRGERGAGGVRGAGGERGEAGDQNVLHLSLFKVLPFLRSVLGSQHQNYAPLTFVD